MKPSPAASAAPQEAYLDFKIINQLKFRFGKQVVPTLLANTPVHDMGVVHTALQPLIAENSSSSGPVGVDELLWDSITGGIFPKVPLPLSVTGATVIISFMGLEINYTLFDNWLEPAGFLSPYLVSWGDKGYDFNKTKGGNVALTYKGQVGPGKLAARAFYFDEDTELVPHGGFPIADDSGWGFGVMYNADKWFLAGEYAASVLKYKKAPVPGVGSKSNVWFGYYVALGGKFNSVKPVYRFDSIDYGNQNSSVFGPLNPGLPRKAVNQCDTEMWHTIGVNYLFNDQVTVGSIT